MGPYARSVALTGSDQAVLAAVGVYRGICLRETAGAAAAVRVYDNPSAASGTVIGAFTLAANASVDVVHDGIWVTGVYVDVISGAVEGSVRVG
ncbi:hypothetical protein BBK14_01805 [Parafrankia soli]|uniref:Uncharacterized protein n=1 Tax=Parafrankia soli TaxID=2599596 RepID=A0A1S1RKM1_9ACTN|nr:hypothetical protein [Parafrankia soli]OHV46607.1 hypothetical protein BBK14_01805 [Parafrankia soli]